MSEQKKKQGQQNEEKREQQTKIENGSVEFEIKRDHSTDNLSDLLKKASEKEKGDQ